MYDRRYYHSKLGKVAAVTIAAMVAFNVLALTEQLKAQPVPIALASQSLELA